MKKTNNNFNNKKPVNYLSKDFSSYKENLLEFIKTYYPNTYRDFSEGSTGMMFVDLVSYVGDVLSYYTDFQFNESFLTNAVERENIISSAKFLGYTPRLSIPSTGNIEVFQLIPSIRDSSGKFIPDYRYALTILEGMAVSTGNNIRFITQNPVDFSVNSQSDPSEISVYSRNDAGEIETFLIKKTVRVKAGQIVTETFTIGQSQQFKRLTLQRSDATEILKVTDSDGNRWYEVDWLAQDVVFTETKNIESNEQSLSAYKNSVPYILGSLKTSKKFTRGIENDRMYIEFGSGDGVEFEDEVIQSIKSVSTNSSRIDAAIDPSVFLKGRSYGEIPKNTTITVSYIAGGGISSNVGSNEITSINKIEFSNQTEDLSDDELQLINTLKNTIRVSNSEPMTGGKNSETNEEIRYNALNHFNSQNRVVSAEDYLVRVLSMPSKFGTIAKAYVTSEDELQSLSSSPFSEKDKSFSVNLFALAFDENKKLTVPNKALIENLRQYLRKNRMLTDDITIYPGNIINIGIDFEIIAFKGENKKEVLFEAIQVAKDFFNIDNMDFNQPINIGILELQLANIDGVQSVSNVSVKNLTAVDGDYSINKYSIQNAMENKILFPSLDPSIFEVKFPDKDIKGKVL